MEVEDSALWIVSGLFLVLLSFSWIIEKGGNILHKASLWDRQ